MLNGQIEEFKQTANVLNNRWIKAWKEKGGKTLGYFYSYIPEECDEEEYISE